MATDDKKFHLRTSDGGYAIGGKRYQPPRQEMVRQLALGIAQFFDLMHSRYKPSRREMLAALDFAKMVVRKNHTFGPLDTPDDSGNRIMPEEYKEKP
jgi:hypothetical protein